MFLSVFEIFKIGIGPSSSHTMGPMVAARRFLQTIKDGTARIPGSGDPTRLEVSLHGSLAFTGKGHATDRAVILGLAGFEPASFDAARAEIALGEIATSKRVAPDGFGSFAFDPKVDLIFDYDRTLPEHANGMICTAYDAGGAAAFQQSYFSVGGGFVQTGDEMAASSSSLPVPDVPFPFRRASEMVAMARASGQSIGQMKRANELTYRSAAELDAGLAAIWQAMNSAIEAGLATGGILPGGLNTRRRAKKMHEDLLAERGNNLAPPHVINDWISMYAMAVNEENANGGRIVTAPTNGAAGVVPASLRYYLDHVPGARTAMIPEFILTAAAIGGIVKWNASISGAEVGCQGEVGSASAMAAGALCAVMGGSPEQVENAAEIALEHHLGMTCDPIKGLVQAPCIERNGLGAIKAVSAASLALRGDGEHLVSLDMCIETMRQTGRDMMDKYKETSQGGLAVNFPEC